MGHDTAGETAQLIKSLISTHNFNYEDVCLYISEAVKGNY